MQVTQTSSEGLKREFKITIPATDLESKLTERLETIKAQAQIKGFRPGKVPLQHLRRVYGKSVMSEVLQDMVGESNRRIVEENKIKLAMQPNVKLPEDEGEIAKVLEAKGDFVFDVAVEVLPEFKIGNLKEIKVEKPVVEISDADVDEALERIAKQNRPFEPKTKKTAKAEDGDRVIIDFKGELDGEAFEGGTGEDLTVEIGAGGFIPGFEENLLGAKAGETREFEVTFPENYGAANLAGKPVKFTVTVKTIEAPGERAVDDELAKLVGMESLDALKEALRGQIERDFAGASRQRLKRSLLDALDGMHSFELPPTLLQQEFDNIWQQVESDMQRAGKSFPDEGKTEDEARAEYRKIAERRVRLGLLLAEIGDKNEIKVPDDEVTRALVERVRQFPADQQSRVWDYFRQTPEAVAEVRAPLFEEKVIDYIAELAEVTEKKVSRDELFKTDDDADAA